MFAQKEAVTVMSLPTFKWNLAPCEQEHTADTKDNNNSNKVSLPWVKDKFYYHSKLIESKVVSANDRAYLYMQRAFVYFNMGFYADANRQCNNALCWSPTLQEAFALKKEIIHRMQENQAKMTINQEGVNSLKAKLQQAALNPKMNEQSNNFLPKQIR